MLITARISRERLLISESMSWHNALNNGPVFTPGTSDEEVAACYARLDVQDPG
ncbi:hypothetical protein Ade02nite_96590 [Paractinoplanes deccanensis]|uniref:Uncharacterized protein n=1 Tax=Paractinoplanes deccanensis TaxID=113561 RepID=A0ABQ3YM02_9ACTN|nr:hypothetical protein [Actinoplanes deccanensis]GID81018.1 hypothetical protein Ade02nite_96590 [Actinoplanes deccanensis]